MTTHPTDEQIVTLVESVITEAFRLGAGKHTVTTDRKLDALELRMVAKIKRIRDGEAV
jgi:hypothetical protein